MPSTALAPSTTSTPPVVTGRNYVIRESASNGFSARVEMTIGDPIPSGLITHLDLTSCAPLNPTVDAVIPVEATVTNPTAFQEDIYFALGASIDGANPLRVQATTLLNGDAACDKATFGNSVPAQPPNSSQKLYGYFVFSSYYSPAFPNGDTQALEQTPLSPTGTVQGDVSTQITVTGPGVTQPSPGDYRIPL